MGRVFTLSSVVLAVLIIMSCSEKATKVKNSNEVTLDSTCLVEGSRLFNENCSSCHKVEENTLGPALKQITKKRELEWLFTYIQNSDELVNRGDALAVMLRAKYSNISTHTKFTYLTEDEIFCVLKYLSPEDDSLDAEYAKIQLEENSKIEVEEEQLHEYADSLAIVIEDEYKTHQFSVLEQCILTSGSNNDYDDPANFDYEQQELNFYESGAKNIIRKTTSGWEYSETKTYFFFNKKLIAIFTKTAGHVGEDFGEKYIYRGQASIEHSYSQTYGQQEDVSGYTNIQQNIDQERNYEEYKTALKGSNFKCF